MDVGIESSNLAWQQSLEEQCQPTHLLRGASGRQAADNDDDDLVASRLSVLGPRFLGLTPQVHDYAHPFRPPSR
ncbi:GD10572 [Drosophila simulans]|uniref:GD10572 n=1 Tax=Drosophila simulans TaxID=7240 RepID=B4QFT6_DROSI|nr:GD10572 [Drosophila simulans]